MKLKGIFVLAGMIASSCPVLRADVIITTETDTSVKIAAIKNLSFDGDFKTGNLVVNFTDGTQTATPIAQIRKVTFKADEEESSIEATKDAPTISTFGDFLFVNAHGGSMQLFSMDGRCRLSSSLDKGLNSFSLSGLNNGIYILSVNGHQVKIQKK